MSIDVGPLIERLSTPCRLELEDALASGDANAMVRFTLSTLIVSVDGGRLVVIQQLSK